ncbi:uncharacterized protein J7T54_002238 [Emericellopsis cladophorae]|uniref:Armadillo repeat-containing protein 8 n=1 Tax=Emericellopsis cladophorae TaxID=2686198 RepID=A0A9P9Y0Q2_9HYPO|nr:uncharacterized protein J7T54_002238 [Emericellopsis cladophorae]KAI6781346.1 hypothetical protein J7T54_002238 [Emericellopsis cladophorae]
MARSHDPPILGQLRAARTTTEQAAALRALKNDAVGHVQKKEQWIGLGVLEPIVRTIEADKGSSKLNGKSKHRRFSSRPFTAEDDAQLQALQCLASFANGGPAFLAPVVASDALPEVLAKICPYANPGRIVLAALRVLEGVVESSLLATPSSPHNTQLLAEEILVAPYFESFNAILTGSTDNHIIQGQIEAACNLISKLCKEEKQQQALTMSGTLDVLALRLASFAVADGSAVPGAVEAAKRDGLFEAFPAAAPLSAKLDPVLQAIAAIVGESKYRAVRLTLTPAILAVFPVLPFPAPKWLNTSRALLGYPVEDDSENMDLSPLEGAVDIAIGTHTSQDQPESPLLPWLVHLVRSRQEEERLVAASLLALLYRAGLGNSTIREASIGLLVVPLVVNMIANAMEKPATVGVATQAKQRQILEQGPVVLARLILDSEHLQRVASKCKAVSVLTRLLKLSYTPPEVLQEPGLWTPYPDGDMDVETDSPKTQLGDQGQDPRIAHLIRIREGALKAVAALASGKEEYRKAFIAEDFLPYVTESLTEYPQKPQPPPSAAKDQAKHSNSEGSRRASTITPGYGRNSLGVLIGACHVIRTISRSLSSLRTALVDHGVGFRILELVKHPQLCVAIPATAAITNLVVDASPVCEPLVEAGVMGVLCEHAHAQDPELRLSALWALKHLVDALGPDRKKECLRELQPAWLMELIHNDPDDDLSRFNNDNRAQAEDDMEEEEDDDDEEGEEGEEEDDEEARMGHQHRWFSGVDGDFVVLDASGSSRMRAAEDQLAQVRDRELNPARKARNNDIAVQEQALDLIRNMIGRPPSTAYAYTSDDMSSMIDHLLRVIGEDRFFGVLKAKLRPRHMQPFSRRNPGSGRDSRVVYPQPQIIAAVIHVLVHIAGSDNEHRQLVMSQRELLQAVIQQSTRDKQVRLGICHLAMNLMEFDERSTFEEAKTRASELKEFGFTGRLEEIRGETRDLDIKERSKEALTAIQIPAFHAY